MEAEKKIFAINGVEYKLIKGKKRWYIAYYVQVSPEVRKLKKVYGKVNYLKDLEKREAACISLIERIAGCTYIAPGTTTSILLDAIADNEDYRISTVQSYNSIVKNFLAWLKKADALCTVDEANAYMKHLKKCNLHQNRRHNIRVVLSGLYNRVSPKNNPFKEIKVKKLSSKSPYYFDDKQLIQLLEHFKEDRALSVAIRLLFYCFIRPREMRLLRVGDVLLNLAQIEVCGDISKNKKTQTVAIPHIFLPALEYLRDYPPHYYVISKNGVPGPDPVGLNYLSTRHRKALKKLRYSTRYTFYSWKHTGVVKAWRAKIDLKTLQMQLRHHSLDMVNEYLKNLGVMDSDVLRYNFPDISPIAA